MPSNPNIALLYGVSGTGTRLDATPTESGENIARLLVVLKPGVGDRGERAATDALRATMVSHPGVEVKFARPQLFSFATPLEIELRGYDLSSLEKAGKKLTALMNASPRFADVKSTVEGGYPEIQVRFDQDRAAALGLTTKQVSDQVVNKVKGSVATRYSFRDRKIDVLVRTQADQRASVDDIRNLIVGYSGKRTNERVEFDDNRTRPIDQKFPEHPIGGRPRRAKAERRQVPRRQRDSRFVYRQSLVMWFRVKDEVKSIASVRNASRSFQRTCITAISVPLSKKCRTSFAIIHSRPA